MQKFLNNYKDIELAVAVLVGDSTITVAAGQGAALLGALTNGDTYTLTIVGSNGTEIVSCTAIAIDVLTVTRAQEGTAALAFAIADKVSINVTKKHLENVEIGRNPATYITGDITLSFDYVSRVVAEFSANTEVTLTAPTDTTRIHEITVMLEFGAAGIYFDILDPDATWMGDLDYNKFPICSLTGACYNGALIEIVIRAAYKSGAWYYDVPSYKEIGYSRQETSATALVNKSGGFSTIKNTSGTAMTAFIPAAINGAVILPILDIATNATNNCFYSGEFLMPQTSGETLEVMTKLYLDSATSKMTTVSAGNTYAGVSLQSSINPTVAGEVYLMALGQYAP